MEDGASARSIPDPSSLPVIVTPSTSNANISETPIDSFIRFPLLPKEIRDMIWMWICFIPRNVHVGIDIDLEGNYEETEKVMTRASEAENLFDFRPFRYFSCTAPPAVLAVNEESCKEGLKHYVTYFDTEIDCEHKRTFFYKRAMIYCNLNVDRVCLLHAFRKGQEGLGSEGNIYSRVYALYGLECTDFFAQCLNIGVQRIALQISHISHSSSYLSYNPRLRSPAVLLPSSPSSIENSYAATFVDQHHDGIYKHRSKLREVVFFINPYISSFISSLNAVSECINMEFEDLEAGWWEGAIDKDYHLMSWLKGNVADDELMDDSSVTDESDKDEDDGDEDNQDEDDESEDDEKYYDEERVDTCSLSSSQCPHDNSFDIHFKSLIIDG